MRWWSDLSRKAKKRVEQRGGYVNDTCMCGDYLVPHNDSEPYHVVVDMGSYNA